MCNPQDPTPTACRSPPAPAPPSPPPHQLRPLIGVGPAADNIHSVAGVVAPVIPLSTTFTNVNNGDTAVFVIVHATTPPGGTTTRAPVTTPP